MPNLYFRVLLIFIPFFTFAQDVNITGKIVDSESKLALEAATVYVTKVKDSSIIDYTITNAKGAFEFKFKPIKEAFYLRVSHQGYEDYKKKFQQLNSNLKLESIEITKASKVLDEIVVKSEAPPIRIKKDTLEFNASSFKVCPDANVETLLKQLPGVEVGTDGKITVNGKEINKILVNGKPFFDKDGKIAIQNLPSELIKKVQITDSKTKKEELSKQKAKSNEASINLIIDKDKEKGLFGKFMGGLGTKERYESSALVNYFKNKRKISVLASSNNINAAGFSMDEIFDNMGGGRSSIYYNDSGVLGIGNIHFDNNKGITQSNLVGINYTDEPLKDFSVNANYFFTSSNSNNTNKTRLENFLATGKFITESESVSNESRFVNKLGTEFEYKIDSTFVISINPNFLLAKNDLSNKNSEVSRNETGTTLNESNGSKTSMNESNNFTNSLTINKSFRRKGRNLSLNFDNDITNELGNEVNNSFTKFYLSLLEDPRNQIFKTKNNKQNYHFTLEYLEPIKDSLQLSIGYNFERNNKKNDTQSFDFNALTQSYTNFNDQLSSVFSSNLSENSVFGGLVINKKKVSLSFSLGTTVANFTANSFYLSNYNEVKRTLAYPYAIIYFDYNFSKTKFIYLNYNFRNEFPEANQILPVIDLSNPLNTFVGNENVSVNKSHNIYGQFRNFNSSKKAGYNFYFGSNLYENQIVISTDFDADRKRITTYKNTSGTFNTWVGLSGNKTFKKDAHTLKFTLGANINYDLSKGFNNGLEFEARTVKMTPRVNLNYDFGELFSMNSSYSVPISKTNYTNYFINSANIVTHKLSLQTTNYWPKNWMFGNDFSYNYNSNIADGFKKDFYLWNTSLSYSFFDKKMIAKVKVYDVLNQNQNATRVVTSAAIRDEENIVLRRYAMFSLTYKIEKFASKEKTNSK
ncbi:hypothetical protein BWK63_01150 [Flavobacterium covae]|uniref:Outer membrane beta-barrel protein n=1 Tax=Flavobacterium covae TaxID=2906076 RepID=A0ABW8PG15_9FLAO|nr:MULTISPECIES: outer membrane beta-barrel protein [Flavobacterium]OWP82274.1 hypothetical protein BWK63_01150 [Flavobacterium covae]POR23364.1 hypothetical protein BWK57_02100 [Flavobacterium columnare]